MVGVFDDGAVGEQDALVDFDGAPFVGRFSGAFFADGVLQSAGRFDGVGFLPVFLEEGVALGAVLSCAAAAPVFTVVFFVPFGNFYQKFAESKV